uniref:Uncharacterized protein n=1 Tax=Globisporangium ultimum (strain ATCC 200006 / CBS 805.95 / DAOM BR144) TaxID=431595 RepID=K3X0Q5_GLOUD
MQSNDASASSSGSSLADSNATTVATTQEQRANNSSCAWREVARSDGTCYVAPRTCRECLNGTPSNGNECVLTPGTTIGFCTGANGCVCVAICETAHWELIALAQLPRTMNVQEEASTCDLPSAFASEPPANTPAPTIPKKQVLAVEDRCTWYTNQTLCGLPRTCYDCLNTPLGNGQASAYVWASETTTTDTLSLDRPLETIAWIVVVVLSIPTAVLVLLSIRVAVGFGS